MMRRIAITSIGLDEIVLTFEHERSGDIQIALSFDELSELRRLLFPEPQNKRERTQDNLQSRCMPPTDGMQHSAEALIECHWCGRREYTRVELEYTRVELRSPPSDIRACLPSMPGGWALQAGALACRCCAERFATIDQRMEQTLREVGARGSISAYLRREHALRERSDPAWAEAFLWMANRIDKAADRPEPPLEGPR